MINFGFTKAASIKGAVDAVARDAASRFIAGGTNLVDLMKRGVMVPEKIVDINSLALRSIEQKGDTISIGALALNSEVASHPLIKTKLPLLTMAIEAGASPQIRNMATVGGNM